MSPLLYVSIIMTVYNGERYLHESIDSILYQTLKNWELIIINDGSTDSTKSIIDKYKKKDKRIKVFNQKNIGQTKSLNRGLIYAKGKYIARLDADDCMLPNRLFVQVKYLDQHPEIGMIGSNVEIIDKNNNKICNLMMPTRINEIKRLMIRGNCFIHSSVMFRREIINKIGFYNENIQPAQDYDYWMRLIQKYKITNLPQFLTKLRKHDSNMSIIENKRQIDETIMIQMDAIKNGYYPKWCIIYILRPYLNKYMPNYLFKIKKLYHFYYYRNIKKNRL